LATSSEAYQSELGRAPRYDVVGFVDDAQVAHLREVVARGYDHVAERSAHLARRRGHRLAGRGRWAADQQEAIVVVHDEAELLGHA
jgi:hypothetical protein